MRIELPSASWADTLLRAEDDAHTMTVAAQQPGPDHFMTRDAATALPERADIRSTAPIAITITLTY